MKKVLKSQQFSITNNQHFKEVITQCRKTFRPGQDGTWIGREVVDAYCELHRMGIAVSYEAWQNDMLVGGFYGLHIGSVFFGESMFSHVSNASKAAFITGVQQMAPGLKLIDCQVHTPHLESLGSRMIERRDFLGMLKEWV